MKHINIILLASILTSSLVLNWFTIKRVKSVEGILVDFIKLEVVQEEQLHILSNKVENLNKLVKNLSDEKEKYSF